MSDLINYRIRFAVTGGLAAGDVYGYLVEAVSEEQALACFWRDHPPRTSRVLQVLVDGAPGRRPDQDHDDADPLFIVQDDGDVYPKNVEQMETFLTHFAEDRAYGRGNYGEVRVWRWLGAGLAEELNLVTDGPSRFNEDDFADQEWSVVGQDGVVYVKTLIHIDGRA